MKAALQLGNQPNKNGLYEIYVRISQGGKMKRIKADIAVAKNQFKSKNHNMKWVYNHPNSAKINADLRLLIDKYDDIVFTSSVAGKQLTPELVLHKITKGTETQSLVKYCEIKMSQMLNYNHRKGYIQSLNNWKEYTTAAKLGDLDFKQIDVYILKGFENHLIKERGVTGCTAYTNLKRIRALFNMAIKEQIIGVGDYIFRAYTMPKCEKTKKEKLTIEELKEFAAMEYEKGTLIKTVQQAFLLAFNLAGVRIEDVLTLKWSYVTKDRIAYQMEKTGAQNSFKLTPQISAILKYYKSINNDSVFIVPILNDAVLEMENEQYKKEIGRKTSLVNKYLKKIATDSGIEKKITSHISRHTFASIAIKRMMGDIVFVQNALQHSDPKITMGYLKSLDNEGMDEGMDTATSL